MADNDGIELTCISHTEHGPSDEQIMKFVNKTRCSSEESGRISNRIGSGSTPGGASNEPMTKEEIQADMDIVKQYAEKFGKDVVETYLCRTMKYSMLRRTMQDRLDEGFGPLGDEDG